MSNRQETVSTSATLAPKYRIPQRPTYKKSYGRKFRDFIARCGHYIRPIRKYILPNFLAVHYFYIIFISILASILMYPCRNAKYIDILFLATGASTQGGLNTINLNQLNTYQQVILYLTSFVTTPIAIHGSLAFVRLYWFERYFDGIKEFSKNDFKMRRTKTILQRELTKQSMQTWRSRTFTNTGRFGSNNSFINGNKPFHARKSNWLLQHAGTGNSGTIGPSDPNAIPRTDSRLKFIETGSRGSRVRKRYIGGRRASTMSLRGAVYNGRRRVSTTTPSESFQERLFSGNLFRRDSDLEGASTSVSMSDGTASTIRSGSGGTAISSYGRDLGSTHGGRLGNTRSTSAHPTEQGTLWSSQSRSRSRGRSKSPHYEYRRINSLHKTGTPSYERFAKMRNPSEIRPQDVYRSLHMMMNQLNSESNESEEGPPLVIQSPFEALSAKTTSKFGSLVQYKLTRSEEELASQTMEAPPPSSSSPPPISPSPSSLSISLRGDLGEPSIIRRDSEDILHPTSSANLEDVNSETTRRELPQGAVSEIVDHDEVSPAELAARQSLASSSQQVDESAVGGEQGGDMEIRGNQPRHTSEQPTLASYYSSRSGSESESESRSSSESGSGSGSTSGSETSTSSYTSSTGSQSSQSTEEFYDVPQSLDGTPSPIGIRWGDEPRVMAERKDTVSPGHSVQFQVNPVKKGLPVPDNSVATDKSQPLGSSKRETRPRLVERVSSPPFLRKLKTGRPFGESLVKSISRGRSYIEKRRARRRERRRHARNATYTNGEEVAGDSGSGDQGVDDTDADEYLADNESDLDGGNSVAASSATEEQLTGNQLLLRSLTMDGANPKRLEELVQQPAFQNMVYEQWKAQERKEKESKKKKSSLLTRDWHFGNDPLPFSLTARSATSEAADLGQQQVNDRPAKSFLRRAITGDFAGLRSSSTSSPAHTGLPKHLTRSLYNEPLDNREDGATDQHFGGTQPSDMSATYSSSITSTSSEGGLNITFEDLPIPKPRVQRAISQTQMGIRPPSMEAPTEYQGADGSLYNINIDEEDGYVDLLPSFTTTLTGNYLSYQPTIGRNSTFVGLSQRQKNELGGVEYRAIKLLCNILLIYYFGITIIAFVFLVPWIIKRKYYANIVRGDGISPTWWGFFTSWGAFGNVGLSLAPDSMSSFSAAPYPIILMSILIVIGNTGFPILLRFIIWIMYKFSRDLSQIRESLGFLLDHPRRCFTMLFPGAATWYLLLSLVVLNVADLVLFIILDLDSSELNPLAKGYRIMDCLFQSISTRTAGYSVFNLVDLHVAMQVTYMLMMYISTLPTAISIRRTNVYEEQSLGLYGKMGSSDPDDGDESSEYDSDESEESEDSEVSKTENSPSSSPHYDTGEAAGQSSKSRTASEHDSASKDQRAVKKKKNRKKTKREDPESSTRSYIGAHLRRQLSYDLWFLFLSLFIICLCENGRIKDLEEPYFNVFSILFEIVSAYGTVGLSLGYPNTDTSFSAQFTTLSKLVIICLLVRGKNRGLPYSLDRAIMLPSERLDHIDQVTDLKLRRHISEINAHDALNQYLKHKATRFVNKFRKVRRDMRQEADGKRGEASKERTHLLEQGRDDEGT